MGIGENLKRIRKENGNMSAEKFAQYIGLNAERLRKWEKGINPKEDDMLLIEEYFNVHRDDLDKIGKFRFYSKNVENNLKEGGEPYINVRLKQKNRDYYKKIPFYDAQASAGNISADITPISAPSGSIDIGDLLNDSEAAIRIYGNSMIPGYPPGCVIGLVKCQSRFIEPGEVYVIETADRRMLKRLFYRNDDSSSEFFTCYSDNLMLFEGGARNGKLAYPPFDIPIAEITNIFMVSGVIKRNSNSIIINKK